MRDVVDEMPNAGVGESADGQPAARASAGGGFPVTFETGRHYKVHKSYIWLGPLLSTIALVVVVALNSISGFVQLGIAIKNGELEINPFLIVLAAIGGLLVLYGLMVGLYYLGYKNMSFVFDEREFSLYSGIITKRRVHVPYARVQSVNHRASVFQRIAGVCTVNIDSAGGAQNRAVRVPYLQLATAERLRVDLFVRKAAVEANQEVAVVYRPEADPTTQLGAAREAAIVAQQRGAAPMAPWQMQAAQGAQGGVQAQGVQTSGEANVLDSVAGDLGEYRGVWGGSVAGLEPVSYEYGLTNRELLLTSVSHGTPFVMAIVIGLSVLVSVVSISFAEDEFARFIASISVPITVLSFALSYVLGIAAIAISYGNFKACRRGSRIEVERGLLQRTFSGIDIERVQSIEVRQSFIRRQLGYCEISLGRIGTSGDNSNNTNNNSKLDASGIVVHPFVKIDRVDEILAGLAPEFADCPREQDLQPMPAIALGRNIRRRCVLFSWAFWLLACATVTFIVLTGIAEGPGFGFSYNQADMLFQIRTAYIVIAAICVVGIAFQAVGAVWWARGSGYALNNRFVVLRNDGLSTRFMAVPRQKVQCATTRSNPFQRGKNLTSLIVTTAAGTSSTSARLLDVPAEAGETFLEWLKPRH